MTFGASKARRRGGTTDDLGVRQMLSKVRL